MSEPINLDAERKKFEAWISSPPYEKEVDRFSSDATASDWPGNYRSYQVQLAWCAWSAATRQVMKGKKEETK